MILILFSFMLAGSALALNNKVGKLPTMGYDMFNAFNCNYTGALVTEQARLMHKYGLVKAGYNTAILRWQCADTEWDYILNGTEMKWRF